MCSQKKAVYLTSGCCLSDREAKQFGRCSSHVHCIVSGICIVPCIRKLQRVRFLCCCRTQSEPTGSRPVWRILMAWSPATSSLLTTSKRAEQMQMDSERYAPCILNPSCTHAVLIMYSSHSQHVFIMYSSCTRSCTPCILIMYSSCTCLVLITAD